MFFFNVKQDLIAELEKEEIPSYIREARLQSLKHQSHEFQELRKLSFGEYTYVWTSIFKNIKQRCTF